MKYLGVTLAVLGMFLAGFYIFRPADCGAACAVQLESLSPADFNYRLSQLPGLLIDVRTPAEFSESRLEGAVNADFNQTAQFAAYLDNLDKNQPYFIYCRSGNRSGQALDLMRQKGFTNVVNLSGGIVAWQSADLPVVR